MLGIWKQNYDSTCCALCFVETQHGDMSSALVCAKGVIIKGVFEKYVSPLLHYIWCELSLAFGPMLVGQQDATSTLPYSYNNPHG